MPGRRWITFRARPGGLSYGRLVIVALAGLLFLFFIHLEPQAWPECALAALGLAAASMAIEWSLRTRGTTLSLQLSNAALSIANEQLNASNKYLQLLATTDPLTGLSNRSHLYQRLEYAIADSHRDHTTWALLLIDLNRFKSVNDTLGHQFGDLLLQQVSLRLSSVLRQTDSASRLGGDEFAILLPETEEAGSTALARHLVTLLESPFQIEGHLLRVGASVGIAIFPEHGADVHTLMRCVDVAMYQAKRGQLGYALYTPEHDAHGSYRTLTDELREALASGNLELHYQPKVQLTTNRISGVEALVRWRHSERGLISPGSFISLAEQTGLIAPLTSWVLEAAIRQSSIWQQAGIVLGVSVNLSIQNLEDPDLPELVAGLLRRYGVAPQMLTLEITESTLMADPEPVLDVLKKLSAAGMRIAIDDFGTGYSALGYLRQLPVNEVKIDKVFVLGLSAQHSASAAKDRMIVRAVTALAHALGLEVVAEGVENAAVYDLLSELRCNVIQGYHVCPPLPIVEFDSWLRTLSPGRLSHTHTGPLTHQQRSPATQILV